DAAAVRQITHHQPGPQLLCCVYDRLLKPQATDKLGRGLAQVSRADDVIGGERGSGFWLCATRHRPHHYHQRKKESSFRFHHSTITTCSYALRGNTTRDALVV